MNPMRTTDMKRILLSLLTIIATATALHADNISVPDTPLLPGDTKTVDVALTNTATDYLGFQMTLSLPAGVSIVKSQCALSDRFDANQEMTIGKKSDGTYTLFWASLDNAPISGTSGTIIHLALTAGDSYTGGTATLSDIRFANSQGQRITLPNCSFALPLAPVEAYALMSTDGKTLTFYNDRLKNFREGTAYALNTGNNAPGWYSEDGLPVTKVVFDPSFDAARPTSTRSWFRGMGSLATIEGMGYLHTDEVTNMISMFNGCSSLSSIDVSGFNTAKVVHFGWMFCNCSSVTTLDVSGFNTAKASSMERMFAGCTKLTSLDVSGFNTAEVTNMTSMFGDCVKLASLDVSGFNTAKVIYMSYMFSACRSLTSLDVSGFNTANVTNMRGMFNQGNNIEHLDVSGFNTAKVKDMSYMFNCCYKLANIDVSHFDTSLATTMQCMFSGCQAITTLDLSNFNMDNVTNTDRMLNSCFALTSLTLPAGFSGINENACTSVGTEASPCELYVPDSFDFGSIDTSGSAFQWKSGWFHRHREVYVHLSADGKTLSFYNDNSKDVREGTVYELNTGANNPGWYSEQSAVTKVVFDPSFDAVRPTSTFSWFVMKQLTTIEGIEYLHTDEVTNMGYMFFNCNNLATLDVTHFNTSKVRGMRFMFSGMWNLTSLDVSHFNTSNVTDMINMFQSCSKLTSLDVTHFDTRKVTGMRSMFYNCKSLTSLDVSGFVTSNVTNMSHMFRDCAALTSIDVSGFNTAKVTEMEYMFCGCNNLQSLDLSGFSTAKVQDMSFMFNNCMALTSLDLSNFDMELVTNTDKMLYNCSALTTLTLPADMSGINEDACTGVGTDTNPCKLTVPDGFDFGDVNTMVRAFQWKTGWFFIDLPFIPGDANNDGFVTVTDVTFTVDKVLGKNTPGFYFIAADVNQDNVITISDVTSIVNIIIGNQ